MKNLVIRKRTEKFTNKQLDEFMQRVVEVSGTLKNNALSKYVSDFTKSAKGFHDLRVAESSALYTQKIHKAGIQADEIFRKIKSLVDYSLLWQTGQMKEAAERVKEILSCYGNIPNVGITKKFVDYDSMLVKLRAENNAVSVLKLGESLNQIQTLTKEFRESVVNRDNYRSVLKGRRRAARIQAMEDYLTLRGKVEAFAEINGGTEVSDFIRLINETLIYLGMSVKTKKDKETEV
jgi:hypothetical protein